MSENDYFGPLTIAGRTMRPMGLGDETFWFEKEVGNGVALTFSVRRGAVPPDDRLWFGKIKLHGIDSGSAAIADVFGRDPREVAEKLSAEWAASLGTIGGTR